MMMLKKKQQMLQQHHGHEDVVKRLQALGTSNSTPVLLAPNSSALLPPHMLSSPNLSSSSAIMSHPKTPPSSSTAAATAATATATAANGLHGLSTTINHDVDTEKLRNDFSAQRDARMYYGCSIALEASNSTAEHRFLMVRISAKQHGHVCIQPLECLKHQAKASRDKLFFTLINMYDTRSANAIKYGDPVWLQISAGTGDTSWEQGMIYMCLSITVHA